MFKVLVEIMSLLFIIFFCKIISNCAFLIEHNLQNNNECIENITRTTFKQENLHIIAEKTKNIFIPTKNSITLFSFNFIKTYQNEFTTKNGNFIINLNELNNNEVLSVLLSLPGRFIIITNIAKEPLRSITALFSKFLSIKPTLNLIVINEINHESIVYLSTKITCNNKKLQKITFTKNCNHIFFKQKQIVDKCSLKLAYIITPPYVIDLKSKTNPGIMVHLINTIQDKSKILFKIQNSSSYNAELRNNGTFNKIIEKLKKKEVDLAIGPLIMNETRFLPFDFGPLVYRDGFRFLVPKPEKLKSYKKLLKVFKADSWLNILYGILLVTFFVYVISLVDNFKETNIFKTSFQVISASIGVGLDLKSKLQSLRFLVFFYSMFTISMDAIYLGKLSSSFAFSSYDDPIRDLEAIEYKNVFLTISWLVERITLIKFVTKTVPSRNRKILLSNLTELEHFQSVVLSQQNGTIILASTADTHAVEDQLVDSIKIGNAYLVLFITSFYMKKNGAFNTILNFWANEIFEKGLILKWINDIKQTNFRPDLIPKTEEQVVVLKLAHFQEIFQILVMGYALSAIIFVFEFVYLYLYQIGFVSNVKALVALLKPPKRIGVSKDGDD